MTIGPVRAVAAQELRRYVALVDRRVLLAAVVTGLLGGLLIPVALDQGVDPEAGLYVAGIEGDSPLRAVLASDPAFRIVEVRAGEPIPRHLDLFINGDTVHYDPTSDKSQSASERLERSTRRWLDDVLEHEADRDAAFPVEVNLVYQPRGLAPGSRPVPPPDVLPEEGPPQESDPTDPDGPGPLPGDDPAPELLEQQGDQQVGLRPQQVDPPFPLQSLLLTFAYLIPLTFVAELYSGSLFAERVRQRGSLLLSGPITGGRIVLGKSLPYIALTAVIAVVVTLLIGAGWLGLLAALPILGFVLASSLTLSLLAPTQRSLTFLLVSVNVLLSTFLFLPPVFAQVDPIAFLSPVAVISASIDGEAVGLGPFLYATLPLAAATTVLAILGGGLYREETLFSPRGLVSKAVDGIGRLTRSRASLLLSGVLLVPFALGLQVFLLIFAVTLDLRTAFVLFLLGSALIEEALKALPAYAQGARAAPTRRSPWMTGLLVGGGFFLGEKSALALSLFGFGLLPQGPEALATFGIAGSPLLVLAPLALHVGAVTMTAFASEHGRGWAFTGMLGAAAVHFAYNTVVILAGVGGGP